MSHSNNLTDNNGKDTFLLFRPTGNKKYKGKDAMGKFEGNSVVMLFKDNNGNAMIREYAGSLNGIIEEINSIKSKYKISDKDITEIAPNMRIEESFNLIDTLQLL